MYRQVFNAQNPQMGSPKSVNGMLQDNFQPQGAWNLTSKPNFPGQTQYGQFKGGTVTGEFLNNHLFGMGMAASGQYPSSGLSDTDATYGTPYPQAQLPQGINHPEAIASGYKSYYGDDSWQQQPMNSLADTSAPAPAPTPTPAPSPTPSPTPDPNEPIILHGRVEKTPDSPPDQPSPPAPAPTPTPTPAPAPVPVPVPVPAHTEPDDSDGWPWPIDTPSTPATPIWRNAQPFSPMQTFPQQQVMAPYQAVTPAFQPQPYLPGPQQQMVHPMIAAYPTARMDYNGVPVHPVHAQEMGQVDHIYTQSGHPALSPVEISQWPKTQQFHQARAQQIQQQGHVPSWQPSPTQIQQRNFQMGSRGGLQNRADIKTQPIQQALGNQSMASGGLFSPPAHNNTLSPETIKFIDHTAQQFGTDVAWAAQKIIYEWLQQDLNTLNDPHAPVQEKFQALLRLGEKFIPELDEKPQVTSQSLGYNPFRGRTPEQIESMFQQKGLNFHGDGLFLEGKGNYHNPQSGRSYHYDPYGKGKYPEEPSHMDIHRSPRVSKQREKRGLSKKRKYPID